jgi:hypothetical protein
VPPVKIVKFVGTVRVNVTGLVELLINVITVMSPEGVAFAVGSAFTVTETAFEVSPP